jgi:hypothetical protein
VEAWWKLTGNAQDTQTLVSQDIYQRQTPSLLGISLTPLTFTQERTKPKKHYGNMTTTTTGSTTEATTNNKRPTTSSAPGNEGDASKKKNKKREWLKAPVKVLHTRVGVEYQVADLPLPGTSSNSNSNINSNGNTESTTEKETTKQKETAGTGGKA